MTLAASGDSAASQGVGKDYIQRMAKRSGLPVSSVVSVRQGLAVAIRDRGVRNAAGVIEGVRLHGEVIDPEMVADLGFASMTSRVDVDCANRRDRVVAMEVFAEPGLKGAPESRAVPGRWIQPSPQAYLADVLRAVCGGRKDAGVQVAALDPSDAPVATAVPKRPALRPAIGMDPPPAPAAKPADPKPAPPKPAPAPAKSDATGARGTPAVQVGALATRAAAEEAAKKAARQAPAGMAARVEAATVDGRDVYRALVRGFASRADANRFCKAFMAAGGACFVR